MTINLELWPIYADSCINVMIFKIIHQLRWREHLDVLGNLSKDLQTRFEAAMKDQIRFQHCQPPAGCTGIGSDFDFSALACTATQVREDVFAMYRDRHPVSGLS